MRCRKTLPRAHENVTSLPNRWLAEGRTETVSVTVDREGQGVVVGHPVDDHPDRQGEQ